MKYVCQVCDYETDFKSNWNRHVKCKTHILNLKNHEIKKRTCDKCGRVFNLSCHLGSHKKVCKFKQKPVNIVNENDKDIRIKELEEKCKMFEIEKELMILKRELENKDKLLENKDKLLENKDKLLEEKSMQINLMKDHNNYIKSENDYHKDLINCAGNMVQSSMNTLNYLLKNYNTSPVLESLKDYTILYNAKNNDEFINNMLYHFEKGKIGQFLGDALLKYYKSEDPKKRPSWNTDTSRLTYINRLLVDNQATWARDNKGIKFTKILIDPFLDHIIKINQDLINEGKNKLENEPQDSDIIIKKMQSAATLIKDIKNKSVAKEINRYCAPQLYFDKNKLMTK